MQGGKAWRPGFILLGLTAFLFACCDRSYAQGTSRMDNRPEIPAAADQGPLGPQTTLTMVRAGNGQGKVTANPVGPSYKKGTPVTLTALPAPYSTFEGWSGSCAGTNRTCTVVLSGDRTVTASFSLKTYSIQVRPPVNGVIHPYGTIKAAHGERRRFQIIPLPGFRVSEVLVDNVSKGAVNSFIFKEVTSDHVLEAVFVKQ
jgi:uncharacterized repeat protein (TIGR02543 family)